MSLLCCFFILQLECSFLFKTMMLCGLLYSSKFSCFFFLMLQLFLSFEFLLLLVQQVKSLLFIGFFFESCLFLNDLLSFLFLLGLQSFSFSLHLLFSNSLCLECFASQIILSLHLLASSDFFILNFLQSFLLSLLILFNFRGIIGDVNDRLDDCVLCIFVFVLLVLFLAYRGSRWLLFAVGIFFSG